MKRKPSYLFENLQSLFALQLLLICSEKNTLYNIVRKFVLTRFYICIFYTHTHARMHARMRARGEKQKEVILCKL